MKGRLMAHNIDTALLRAFVAVAETGGMTSAGRLLNLTQAAVSQQAAQGTAQAAAGRPPPVLSVGLVRVDLTPAEPVQVDPAVLGPALWLRGADRQSLSVPAELWSRRTPSARLAECPEAERAKARRAVAG